MFGPNDDNTVTPLYVIMLQTECATMKDCNKDNVIPVLIEDGFNFNHPKFPKHFFITKLDLLKYKPDNPAFWKKLAEEIKSKCDV